MSISVSNVCTSASLDDAKATGSREEDVLFTIAGYSNPKDPKIAVICRYGRVINNEGVIFCPIMYLMKGKKQNTQKIGDSR